MDSAVPFTGAVPTAAGLDLPQGLSMQLAQHPVALANYGRLSPNQQSALIGYIQSSTTAQQAKTRIADTVAELSNG